MLKEAYEYGQRLAAAERGYGAFDDFNKEAAGLMGVGRAAWNVGSRGALGGAAVGAAGNMAFGDSSQGLMERAGKGALGGAAVGGALGGIGGAVGQKMFRGHLGDGYRAMRQSGMTKEIAGSRLADQVRQSGPAFYSSAMQRPNQMMGQARGWMQGQRNKMWGTPNMAAPTQGSPPGIR